MINDIGCMRIVFGIDLHVWYAVAYLGFHFGGGGVQNFLEKWGYLHSAKRHAARGELATRLLWGFGGMLPRENFKKWCNFGAF